MDFDLYEYKKVFEKGGLQEAIKYKNKFIPNKLYKFIPLGDDNIENEKRLISLESNQTWLSNYKQLNDPFEFKALIVDEKRLRAYNWDDDGLKLLNENLRKIKNFHYIYCLSTNFDKSLPMWAYYTNNHTGFCIEYIIEEPSYIYKVLYTNQRYQAATIVSNLILNKKDGLFYFDIFRFSFVVKHVSWEHENEYRLIFPHNREKKGILVDNSQLGIKANRIIAGMGCKDPNKSKLKEIGKKINCETYQMFLDDNSPNFELQDRKI